jgi:general secretion pathway protein B
MPRPPPRPEASVQKLPADAPASDRPPEIAASSEEPRVSRTKSPATTSREPTPEPEEEPSPVEPVASLGSVPQPTPVPEGGRDRNDTVARLREPPQMPAPPKEEKEESDPSESLLRLWQLPTSVQSSIPKLMMTVHVYSPDEQARFVRINGRIYREGGQVTKVLRLDAITRDGVVLNYRGKRFVMDRQ